MRQTADCAKDGKLVNDIFLQPWFVSKAIGWKIQELLPVSYRHKMRYYFDDYGCLRCGRKRTSYGFNGFCKVCVEAVMVRMHSAMQRRQKDREPLRIYKKSVLKRVPEARQLLK